MSTKKSPSGVSTAWPWPPHRIPHMNKASLTAAHRWAAARGVPKEFSQILGATAKVRTAIPGHEVDIPGGKKPSRCDVFAEVKTEDGVGAIGITAKANDGFGQTIREWQKDRVGGGRERLSALCHTLGTPYPPPPDLRYQPFHRLAAAIYEADVRKADFAAMIVQSFSSRQKGLDDFKAFCKLLGVNLVPEKPFRTTLSGRRILLAWVDSSNLAQPASAGESREDIS